MYAEIKSIIRGGCSRVHAGWNCHFIEYYNLAPQDSITPDENAPSCVVNLQELKSITIVSDIIFMQ